VKIVRLSDQLVAIKEW